jgi:hypothetical protein
VDARHCRDCRLGKMVLTSVDPSERFLHEVSSPCSPSVFRTNLCSALADGTREGMVAFEADELEDRMQSGWSVVVVRIAPAQVTGRRFHRT